MIRLAVFIALFSLAAWYAIRRYGWWGHIRRHPWAALLLFAAALQTSWLGATKPTPPDPDAPKPAPPVIIHCWLDADGRIILIHSPLIEILP